MIEAGLVARLRVSHLCHYDFIVRCTEQWIRERSIARRLRSGCRRQAYNWENLYIIRYACVPPISPVPTFQTWVTPTLQASVSVCIVRRPLAEYYILSFRPLLVLLVILVQCRLHLALSCALWFRNRIQLSCFQRRKKIDLGLFHACM